MNDMTEQARHIVKLAANWVHGTEVVLNALDELDRLQADNARLRDQVNAIVAIAESYECLAQDPAVETSVSQERLGFAQDIYRALGIEMQK